MFEGIILIIFFIVGGLTALLAVFFFVIAAVRQSKTMFKFGLLTAIVPLFLYSLTYWFYDIHIPKLNKQEEKRYVGTYVKVENNNPDNKEINYTHEIKLILNADNTFQLDQNTFTNFYGKGTWKAGATDDGQFEFRDNTNSIIFWAIPSDENKLEIDKNFNDRQKVVFIK
jgi:hypothetical protein